MTTYEHLKHLVASFEEAMTGGCSDEVLLSMQQETEDAAIAAIEGQGGKGAICLMFTAIGVAYIRHRREEARQMVEGS